MTDVTPTELEALRRLETASKKKGWLAQDKTIAKNGEVLLGPVAIDKVAALLAKAMKPGRQLVSAVRFANGKMTEIRAADIAIEAPAAAAPYREDAGAADPSKAERAAAKKEKATAVTVPKPTLGCPAPAFEKAEIQASRILEQFLSAEQLEDFRLYNRFVSTGADSGHRYMVTSRRATDSLAQYHRSLFDLDEGQEFCVHDWTVPAAEEMLTLHVLLGLPGYERWMRRLPD